MTVTAVDERLLLGACEDCHGPALTWFAPNALWNLVIGGPDATDDPGGMLCPNCFIKRAEAAGIVPTAWVLDTETLPPSAVEAAEVVRLGPSLEERMPTPEQYADLEKIITDAFAKHNADASPPPAPPLAPQGVEVRALEDLRTAVAAIDGTMISHFNHSDAGSNGAKAVVALITAAQNVLAILSAIQTSPEAGR